LYSCQFTRNGLVPGNAGSIFVKASSEGQATAKAAIEVLSLTKSGELVYAGFKNICSVPSKSSDWNCAGIDVSCQAVQ